MKKERENIQHLTVDPGYLMLAMYILSVVVLVLIGWLGAAGAGASQDAADQALLYEIQNNNVQKSPARDTILAA